MQCFLWLFEKVIKYINRNAYIEIGKGKEIKLTVENATYSLFVEIHLL